MPRIALRKRPCKHKLRHYEELKGRSTFMANAVFHPKDLDEATIEALKERGWKNAQGG